MKNNTLKTVLKYLICVFGFWYLIFNFAYALPISRDSLDCGLRVLTYQTDRLPMIEMRWVSYAGSIYDPTGKTGLANLTTKMLARGTRTRTASQISQELEFVGASISDATGYDISTLHMRFLSKDLDLALDILSDVLQHSIFDNIEINKVKIQTVGEIKQSLDYPSQIGWQKFHELLYQNHAYAREVTGDTVTVKRITRKDMIDFYNQYYSLGNGFLTVAGDFDKQELLTKIESKFCQMRKGKPETGIPEFAPGPYSNKPKGYIIQRPDLNQSYIYIGFPGIAEKSADNISIRVMNFILGGSALTSRIGNAVRETGGLAYDARSGFYRRLYGGAFASTTQTSDPQTAIRYILAEIKKIYERGATQDELARAKTFFIGSFPFSYDATRDKIDLLQSIELYNRGLDYPEKFTSYIEQLTLAQINQVAQKYLYPDNYLLVIVTNLSKEELGLENIEWLN
ncbi:MAG: insulinase family protein [Candidatus Latescibacteria bacterium]|nr:insulinase family protein [Candidatus Latescibacterota bacterium]